MPQFRQDFITKEWVIVAPERAKRPDQFRQEKSPRNKLPERDEHCPFCPGNEDKTPPAVYVRGNSTDWRIRVVPNKFAAVNPQLSPKRNHDGKFLSAEGFGVAEVIIESPSHNANPSLMSDNEVKEILESYKQRYIELSKNESIDLITIFRNHGPAAGTSLAHPHSQVIATPIVPPQVRQLMQQALLYHDTYGGCPYCVMLEEEISQGERIVANGKHFVVFCPYASQSPFQIRIMPKRHYSLFDRITAEETNELAHLLRTTLKKLDTGLGDPDYNLVIRSSPTSDGELHYEHWRMIIIPRITTPAGFELGSGIYINTMPPESCAAFLRDVNIE
ncbi:MAG: galactose-1-phosphate uridylyltransferase [Pseudomonadota bacterium]